ncbi:MAG: type II toxin-antitoxin system RelE/ParE family toxin [Acidobacteria bacterium]|nr:type II toxin-antitoxin system RelE/ParE family toxin [Acidobacteriota bacterium]
MKRIIFSEEAKADIRALPQYIAMNVLTAIHGLAEHGSGNVKELKAKAGEKRLRVGDHRVRYTEEHPDILRIHTVKNRRDAYR